MVTRPMRFGAEQTFMNQPPRPDHRSVEPAQCGVQGMRHFSYSVAFSHRSSLQTGMEVSGLLNKELAFQRCPHKPIRASTAANLRRLQLEQKAPWHLRRWSVTFLANSHASYWDERVFVGGFDFPRGRAVHTLASSLNRTACTGQSAFKVCSSMVLACGSNSH